MWHKNGNKHFMQVSYVDENFELVAACKAGDRRAFQKLYKLYAKSMLNAAFRILGSTQEAEDVLQEAFIVVFKTITGFRQETTFGLWLKGIVISRSLSALKAKNRKWVPMTDENMEEITAPEEEQIDQDIIQLKVSLINAAMQQLPDGYKTIISLYLFEGYDHGEIAEILHVTESTVRVQYLRAKRRLLEKAEQLCGKQKKFDPVPLNV